MHNIRGWLKLWLCCNLTQSSEFGIPNLCQGVELDMKTRKIWSLIAVKTPVKAGETTIEGEVLLSSDRNTREH